MHSIAKNNAEILSAAFVLISISLAIAETVIAVKDVDGRHMCGPGIWANVVTLGAVHWLVSIIAMFACALTFFRGRDYYEDIGGTSSSLIFPIYKWTLMNGLVSLWSVVIIFMTSNSCRRQITDEYPDMWYMIGAEVIIFGLTVVASVVRCFF